MWWSRAGRSRSDRPQSFLCTFQRCRRFRPNHGKSPTKAGRSHPDTLRSYRCMFRRCRRFRRSLDMWWSAAGRSRSDRQRSFQCMFQRCRRFQRSLGMWSLEVQRYHRGIGGSHPYIAQRYRRLRPMGGRRCPHFPRGGCIAPARCRHLECKARYRYCMPYPQGGCHIRTDQRWDYTPLRSGILLAVGRRRLRKHRCRDW